MSSLQASVLQRRALEGAPVTRTCVGLGTSQSALVLNTWNEGRWVLPWSYFLGAHFQDDADTEVERLVLHFAHAEISVEGDHLCGLVEEFAAQRIEWLRELPDRFRPDLRAGETFIRRLVIRKLTDLPPRPAPISS